VSNKNNSFVKKYLDISQEKNTILCVGIDPAIPSQRSKNVIPSENRLEFIRNLVTDVAPYASVIKMNRQYLIGLTIDEIRAINIHIHQNNMLSIIDHKLSDIGSSNMSAIFWFKEESFDAFTFSPFAGNVLEATQYAHSKNLGIIVLTLMSNPEAEFQKQALIENKPENLELVLTGRYAHPEIVKIADYVTEMLEIKHPYQQRVEARKGVDF